MIYSQYTLYWILGRLQLSAEHLVLKTYSQVSKAAKQGYGRMRSVFFPFYTISSTSIINIKGAVCRI